MVEYDDKCSKAIKVGNQLLINEIKCKTDVTFKASYIITSELKCRGKVTALFDLIIHGDVQAREIDVKGRFICTGKCTVSGEIVVNNDIWCEEIEAFSIVCHDRVVAQSINATTIAADGSIIVGRTLAIESEARTSQNVICGETAYGAGKIAATSILTAEPLDMDDGEDALESPYQYTPKAGTAANIDIFKESAKYSKSNDYSGYISALMNISDETAQKRLKRYVLVLFFLEDKTPSDLLEYRDASLLIWLLEMSQGEYFKGWNTVIEWTDAVLKHFQDMAEGKAIGIIYGRPAEKLLKGYTVAHDKFGTGVVNAVIATGTGVTKNKTVVVNFEEFGMKKFPIPDSLKFFRVLSENPDFCREEKIRGLITCTINGYEEWLSAMNIINNNKEYLGESLHSTLFNLLIEKIGLKAQFIENRFKEMGWS